MLENNEMTSNHVSGPWKLDVVGNLDRPGLGGGGDFGSGRGITSSA